MWIYLSNSKRTTYFKDRKKFINIDLFDAKLYLSIKNIVYGIDKDELPTKSNAKYDKSKLH